MMGVPSCGTAGNRVMGFVLGNTHVVQKQGCAIVDLRATAHPSPGVRMSGASSASRQLRSSSTSCVSDRIRLTMAFTRASWAGLHHTPYTLDLMVNCAEHVAGSLPYRPSLRSSVSMLSRTVLMYLFSSSASCLPSFLPSSHARWTMSSSSTNRGLS